MAISWWYNGHDVHRFRQVYLSSSDELDWVSRSSFVNHIADLQSDANFLAFVSGVIETDEVRLGSRVGGRIEQVLVCKEGDHVSAVPR